MARHLNAVSFSPTRTRLQPGQLGLVIELDERRWSVMRAVRISGSEEAGCAIRSDAKRSRRAIALSAVLQNRVDPRRSLRRRAVAVGLRVVLRRLMMRMRRSGMRLPRGRCAGDWSAAVPARATESTRVRHGRDRSGPPSRARIEASAAHGRTRIRVRQARIQMMTAAAVPKPRRRRAEAEFVVFPLFNRTLRVAAGGASLFGTLRRRR